MLYPKRVAMLLLLSRCRWAAVDEINFWRNRIIDYTRTTTYGLILTSSTTRSCLREIDGITIMTTEK